MSIPARIVSSERRVRQQSPVCACPTRVSPDKRITNFNSPHLTLSLSLSQVSWLSLDSPQSLLQSNPSGYHKQRLTSQSTDTFHPELEYFRSQLWRGVFCSWSSPPSLDVWVPQSQNLPWSVSASGAKSASSVSTTMWSGASTTMELLRLLKVRRMVISRRHWQSIFRRRWELWDNGWKTLHIRHWGKSARDLYL